MALVVLIGGADAFAQDRRPCRKIQAEGAQVGGGVDTGAGRSSPAARSDVPSEKNLSDPNDPLSKENAALDRKIKSICRGC
jgi:hypothetical protein